MKKKYLIYAIPVMALLSCGGSEESDQTEEVVEEIAEDDVVIDESVLIAEMSEEYIPENPDGKWQIDDYAEMMSGGKIFNSTDEMSDEERMYSSYYEVKDLKGGYAKITGSYEGWSEFVVWRMKDGNDLVASMTAGCGPVCDYSFKFSIYNQGELVEKDAAEKVLPIDEIFEQQEKVFKKVIGTYSDVSDDAYAQTKYNLPREGTSMMVDMEIGEYEIRTHLVKLSWDKEKFSIEEYYDDAENIMYK